METYTRFIMAVAACALIVGLPGVGLAKIIYVDGDAGGANDGSSWANAFPYLQTALNAAASGDEIRVAQGTHRPDQGIKRSRSGVLVRATATTASSDASFWLKNGVAILGGFAGADADDPNLRDVENYRTVLSGDLQANDIDLWGTEHPLYEVLRDDNCLRVVESWDTDETAVLDGFVIRSAVDSGLYNHGGSPTIANCTFVQNTTPDSGGGLRCEGGRPALTNCLFQENIATGYRGGAIYALAAQLTLVDCRFIGNWVGSEGGAICCVGSDVSLLRCTFEKNSAWTGGAIHQTDGMLTLVECTFEDNAATQGGATAFAVQKASMTRCVFVKNWATGSGGAIDNGGTPLTLDGCEFRGNLAGCGGAIYASGLAFSDVAGGPVMVMTHCLFTGNRGWIVGGALYTAYAEVAIFGCTFADNWAERAATLGWLLRTGDASYRIGLDNCIILDGEKSIASSLYMRTRTEVAEGEDPNLTIRYSDVQGGWPGEGNIDVDPCFAASGWWGLASDTTVVVSPDDDGVTWVEGDYHIKSQAGRWDPTSETWILDEVTSPCIDAGDPNSPVGDEPEPNGGRVNMGVYGGTAEASKSS